jgi:hypothetical protein
MTASAGIAAVLLGAKVAFASVMISSVSPSAAPNTGSVRLTINGTGFLPGASARLVRDGQADVPGDNVVYGTDVGYESISRIKATFDLATRSPGRWDVKVTQVDGTGTCNACFAVAAAAPQAASVSPASRGQGAADQQLTIAGSNFARAATVSISGSGVTLEPAAFVDTSHLTVVADIASNATVGPRDVTVANTDGQSSTCNGCFTVNGKPTVTATAPNSRGQGAENQNVVLTGTNFLTGASADFGVGITVNSTSVQIPTSATANVTVSPAAVPGSRDITMRNGDGGVSSACSACFTVNAAPAPIAASPAARGQGVTNQNIEISGAGFRNGASVSFSGGGITVNSTTFDEDGPVDALIANVSIAADAATGQRNVTVTNPDAGKATCSACFAVNAHPTVISVAPASRGQGADDQLSIEGAGFAPGADVSISGSGIIVNSTTFVSSSEVTADVSVDPAAATGPRDVSVLNNDGGAGSCSGCFAVNVKPSVTGASPSALGRRATNQDVTVTGHGFQSGATLTFSGIGHITVNSVTFVDSSTLVANVSVNDIATSGLHTITVSNPDGGDAGACATCFTVNPAPKITSLSPTSRGQGAATHDVDINGSNFVSGASVSFSGTGISVSSVNFVSSSKLIARVTVAQRATPGARDLYVVNPDAGNDRCEGCFTVAPAPLVTLANPEVRGQGAPDQDVTIAGGGFSSGAVVSFGEGITVNSTTVSSPSSIDVNVSIAPAAAVGNSAIVVVNTDGGRGECADCFAVSAGPRISSVSPSALNRGAASRNVSIAGSGFGDDTTLSFGSGITVSGLTHSNSTSMVARISIATGATAGARDVVASNPDGGRLVCAGCFTVGTGPVVNSVSPVAALNSGPVTLTLNGAGYTGSPAVHLQRNGFDDIAGTNVTVVSPTQLTAAFDLTFSAPGPWTMRVTGADDESDTCRCFSIAQGAPTLTSIDPNAVGQGATDHEITLHGSGFAPGASVTVSGSGVHVDSVEAQSTTEMTALVSVDPGAAVGPRNVTVTNADEQDHTCTACLTINVGPGGRSVAPASRAQGVQDADLSLTGSDLVDGASASVSGSGVTVNSSSVSSPTSMALNVSIDSDAPTGARDVKITNPDGGSVACTGCFTVNARPLIESLTPSSRGQGAQDDDISITGSDFAEGADMEVSGDGVTVNSSTVEGLTSLVASVSVDDDAPVGARDVIITNADGGVATCEACFTINAKPELESLSPSSTGRGATAHNVLLTGTDFADGGTVTVSGSGVSAGSTSLVSSTQLRVPLTVADNAALGTRDVTIVNADGGAATCLGCLTVDEVQGRYTALSPARVLDTRDGTGGRLGKLAPGQTISVPVVGRGGVPTSGVSAVALNVIAGAPTSSGSLTVFPAGTTRPSMSNVSFVTGKSASNLVVAEVGSGGKVNVYNSSGNTHVIFDVQGWYGDEPGGNDGRFQPLTPARVADTRSGLGGRTGQLGSGQSMDVQVTGRGGIPSSGVSAVVMNVTLPKPTADGYLLAYPAGVAKPRAANVTYLTGQATSKRVLAKVGSGGKVTLYNSGGSSDVIVDVGGWFTDASTPDGQPGAFVPIAATRVLNTTMTSARSLDLQMTGAAGLPTAGVSSVVLNVTATNASKSTYLVAHPTGATRPSYADINAVAGKTANNLVVVRVGSGGKVRLYNNTGDTKVTVEILGYYVSP